METPVQQSDASASHSKVRAFDHYILPTRDLAESSTIWRSLGFRLLDHARHAGLGTTNHIIQFDSSYFELLEYAGAPPPHRAFWESIVAARRGLALLSLTSDDLTQDIERLGKQGIAFAGVNHVIRPVRMPDGRIEQLDSVNSVAIHPAAPLLSIFLTEHRRPDVTYSECGRPHENGAFRTMGFVYVADDPSAHRRYLAAFLGEPSASQPEFLEFPTTSGRIEVLGPAELSRRYPAQIAGQNAAVRNHPVALRLGVTDLATTRSALSRGGAQWIEDDRRILVSASQAEGVALEFIVATHSNDLGDHP
jgi:hypothetical protein